jgi:hypothetical protein
MSGSNRERLPLLAAAGTAFSVAAGLPSTWPGVESPFDYVAAGKSRCHLDFSKVLTAQLDGLE